WVKIYLPSRANASPCRSRLRHLVISSIKTAAGSAICVDLLGAPVRSGQVADRPPCRISRAPDRVRSFLLPPPSGDKGHVARRQIQLHRQAEAPGLAHRGKRKEE